MMSHVGHHPMGVCPSRANLNLDMGFAAPDSDLSGPAEGFAPGPHHVQLQRRQLHAVVRP